MKEERKNCPKCSKEMSDVAYLSQLYFEGGHSYGEEWSSLWYCDNQECSEYRVIKYMDYYGV